MKITITEALAEIKTIDKRIKAKREFVKQYSFRQEQFKDPLEKDGGSLAAVASARQAIADLQSRIIKIRTRIQQSNLGSTLQIGEEVYTVAEWLTWRKEIAPFALHFLRELTSGLRTVRQQAQAKGAAVIGAGAVPTTPTDVVINLNEGELSKQIENLEMLLGQLDGRLSLFNATTTIELED